MNRRDFLHYSGLATLVSTGVISPVTLLAQDEFPAFSGFNDLLEKLISLNDDQIQKIIAFQNQQKNSRHFGGVADSYKIYNPHSTAGLIKTLSLGYYSDKSKFYSDVTLVEPMILAAKYLLNIQHKDGTIDLLSTNFHSTPDTAFVVEPLWLSYQLLQKINKKELGVLLDLLKKFMLKAGEAFVAGGIHTPNHRWVVSMTLSMLNHSFPDERYKKRIEEWLREGIDIDEDGQYEEKSTYIYTPLTNRCLMNIAIYDNRPELWDIIEKNLEMSMYYVHPNGEIATEASGRQDQFQVGFMEHYYLPYKMAATRNNNPEFWAMVKLIEKTAPEKLLTYLPYFFIHPALRKDSDSSEKTTIPDHYSKEFPGSNLVRIRRGKIDATVLGNNPTFLTISKGNAVLASVRMASAFFGRGQFKASSIERVGDKFVLNWNFSWGYFQPLPAGEKPNYRIPFDEDRKRRQQSEIQEINAKIEISEKNKQFLLDVELSGTENVPLAIEFAFRENGILSGVEPAGNDENTFLLRSGSGKFTVNNDTLEFGPGVAENDWTAIRGALPKPGGKCVYITGFTPFKKIITIG